MFLWGYNNELPSNWIKCSKMFIPEWTKKIASCIKEVLTSSAFLGMISRESLQDQVAKTMDFFQKEKQFTVFWFGKTDTTVSIIQQMGNRFQHTRLIIISQTLFSLMFSYYELLSHIKRDAQEEKLKNVELLFQSIIDCVCYSLSPWKAEFFTSNKNNKSTCPMKTYGNQVIHACLLITAIQECSKAFSQELAVNNYLEEVKLKMAISAEDFNRILTDKQRCDDEGVAQDNR